jgi:release factor glutamine methyltransferase
LTKVEGKSWKLIELLKVSENLLREKGVDNPRLNAELMLADVLKVDRINLYLDFEKPLNDEEISRYKEVIKRRLNKEPLQYILGFTEFWGLKFEVNSSVLIPRPETEMLVEKTIDIIKSDKLENPKILEIGTGSGCIAVALGKSVNCNIEAIDINPKTLETAARNAAMHNVRNSISFLNKDIFKDYTNFNNFDLVLSNPPYIHPETYSRLQAEINQFEPRIAITDNKNGLTFYEKIIELSKNNKSHCTILLEIGDGRSEEVKNIFTKRGIKDYRIYNDLQKIPRVIEYEVNKLC